MPRTPRMLFVCSGNLHRSVMGAALMEAMMAQAGFEVRMASAGTLGLRGVPSPPEVLEVCAEYGLDVSGHRSQPLTLSLLQNSNAIIVMAEHHGDSAIRIDPKCERRVHFLGDYADPPGDVFDPIGQDVTVFRQSRDHILAALQRLFPELLEALRLVPPQQ